jgi:hypothetical protein
MALQGIVPVESSTAEALEVPLIHVYLPVTLQIVRTDELVAARVTLVAAVVQMGLHVGTNVLLSSKRRVLAILIEALVLAIVIRALDESIDFLVGDAGRDQEIVGLENYLVIGAIVVPVSIANARVVALVRAARW